MARKQAKQVSRYRAYPKEDGLRVGCKVSWHYYRDKVKADEASKAAQYNAAVLEAEGYEWGYQVPGSVTLMTAGEWKGMYEVCTP